MDDFMGKALLETMSKIDEKRRFSMLQSIDELHLSAFITWLGIEKSEGRFRKEVGLKEIADKYVEQFSESIYMSVRATCEANKWMYDSAEDHNKKVRDEILKELDN